MSVMYPYAGGPPLMAVKEVVKEEEEVEGEALHEN